MERAGGRREAVGRARNPQGAVTGDGGVSWSVRDATPGWAGVRRACGRCRALDGGAAAGRSGAEVKGVRFGDAVAGGDVDAHGPVRVAPHCASVHVTSPLASRSASRGLSIRRLNGAPRRSKVYRTTNCVYVTYRYGVCKTRGGVRSRVRRPPAERRPPEPGPTLRAAASGLRSRKGVSRHRVGATGTVRSSYRLMAGTRCRAVFGAIGARGGSPAHPTHRTHPAHPTPRTHPTVSTVLPRAWPRSTWRTASAASANR